MIGRTISVACALVGACRGDEPQRAPPVAQVVVTPVTPAAGARQDSVFGGTTRFTHRPRPGVTQRSLSAIRTSAETGFDRVVFEFAGDSAPGYRVEYATQPVRLCGSGDVVSVAGDALLVVRFEPARAHDDRGVAAPFERERAPGYAAVKEMKVVCDFEGQVEWVLGLATTLPYRVEERSGPARLVLDVGHRP